MEFVLGSAMANLRQISKKIKKSIRKQEKIDLLLQVGVELNLQLDRKRQTEEGKLAPRLSHLLERIILISCPNNIRTTR